MSVVLGVIAVAGLLGLYAPELRAEEAGGESDSGGVANSGMQQGTGAIATRSDVALSIESLPGTSALRLGAIGEAVGTQMTAIRTCYSDVTAERPTVTGELQLQVRISEGPRGSVTLEVARDATGDPALTQCVVDAIQRAPFMNVRGPAGGTVVIQFQNTAAEGAAAVARERDQGAAVVQMVDGNPQVSGRTLSGEVELSLTGRGSTSAESVAAAYRAIQSRIGTLLDCRRRASRRGQDPTGEMVIALTVPHRGFANGRRRSSTVADPTAPRCAIRGLRLALRGESAAAGAYTMTITFHSR